jgi:hypothetical protein
MGVHEIGIHPNFSPAEDLAQVLDSLLDLYPTAQGVRCHTYYQNSHLLDLFVERGLRYDSNIVMFRYQGIRPFYHWNGLIRLPVFWEDDVNCLAGANWDVETLSMSISDALYVFAFHPVHVFLNTETMARYYAAKPYYQDPTRLREFVNPESSGVGTRCFLKRLLARFSKSSNRHVKQLCEFAENEMLKIAKPWLEDREIPWNSKK